MTLIRYYGHLGQRTGYGRAAYDLCMALRRAGVELEIRPLAKRDEIDPALLGALMPFCTQDDATLTPGPDAVIVHTLPYDCAKVFQIAKLGEPSLGVGPVVAYTTWEALSAPHGLAEHLAVFDQRWTPSLQSTLAPVGDLIVPHCFDELTLDRRRSPRSDHASRPMKDRFTFYYVGAWTARKNVEGLVRAYCAAFTKADDVGLFLHSPNVTAQQIQIALASTGLESDQLPELRFSNRWVQDEEVWALHAGADCFVSMSHGEAWNLPAFDAFLAQRMCVVPDRQGSETYLEGSDAVRVRTAPGIPRAGILPDAEPGFVKRESVQGLDCRGLWMEPDLVHAAELMRQVYESRQRSLGVPPGATDRFTYTAVAKLALGLLEDH